MHIYLILRLLFKIVFSYAQDLATQEYRISEVAQAADRLIKEDHPDSEVVQRKREVKA